jgi:hypothetical protein
MISKGSLIKFLFSRHGTYEIGLVLKSYIWADSNHNELQAIDILWDTGEIDKRYIIGSLSPHLYEVISPS